MSLRASLKKAADRSPAPEKIPEGYDPRQDQGEYMNPIMRAFFYRLLLKRLEENAADINQYRPTFEKPDNLRDAADVAFVIADRQVAASHLEHLEKLRKIIRTTLHNMQDPAYEYGYDKDGDEIGVDRLLAIPWATTSADQKDLLNRIRRTYRPERGRDLRYR